MCYSVSTPHSHHAFPQELHCFSTCLTCTYLPIILLIPLPLHRHLPRPQRLSQPTRQTRRFPITIRSIPPTPPTTRRPHTHRTISRCRRRRGFSTRTRSFRWSWGRGFCFCGEGAGAVYAVCCCRCWWWGWDGADCWSGRGGWCGGFGCFFDEVGGWNPGLGRAVEFFGEPPACG